ncbi:MAG: 3'(2'),5'-bisphosphate nucleotidase CysQ [Hyphomicrobiaceae bacterium]|nr:3'(2'),5'-bisphosphate nucleotidase CysQ [Hyphomicrobiaceae bacterium]
MKTLAEGLIPVALDVGKLQLAHRAAGVTAERKADHSPVTIADRESEALILAALARLAPDTPVIAEELATEGALPAVAQAFFLVDPLDGTKGYVRGGDEFTVNVALVENRVPVFGLVYAPALSDLYVTVGPDTALAARVDPASARRTLAEIDFKEIRTRVPDLNGLAALTSQSHLNTATARFLDGYTIVERKAVSSSLKFGLIARGEWDLYPRAGPTSEWDTAAGHAILAAAGGCVTTLGGDPLVYGKQADKFVNPDFVAWGRQPIARQKGF